MANRPLKREILIYSDMHQGAVYSTAHEKLGPVLQVLNALQLKAAAGKIEAVCIINGDDPELVEPQQMRGEILEQARHRIGKAERYFLEDMRETFFPDVKMVYIEGNHGRVIQDGETIPPDYYLQLSALNPNTDQNIFLGDEHPLPPLTVLDGETAWLYLDGLLAFHGDGALGGSMASEDEQRHHPTLGSTMGHERETGLAAKVKEVAKAMLTEPAAYSAFHLGGQGGNLPGFAHVDVEPLVAMAIEAEGRLSRLSVKLATIGHIHREPQQVDVTTGTHGNVPLYVTGAAVNGSKYAALLVEQDWDIRSARYQTTDATFLTDEGSANQSSY